MSEQANLHSTFMRLRKQLMRYVSRLVAPDDIEDIVQETYVRLCKYEKNHSIEKHDSLIFKAARNIALDHMKRSENRLSTSMDVDEISKFLDSRNSLDNTLARTLVDEQFDHFCEAVRHLPSRCRRAFVLKKVYGFTQKEIAGYMGISEKTVEQHIAMGIRRATSYLAHHECMPAGDAKLFKSQSSE